MIRRRCGMKSRELAEGMKYVEVSFATCSYNNIFLFSSLSSRVHRVWVPIVNHPRDTWDRISNVSPAALHRAAAGRQRGAYLAANITAKWNITIRDGGRRWLAGWMVTLWRFTSHASSTVLYCYRVHNSLSPGFSATLAAELSYWNARDIYELRVFFFFTYSRRSR